MIKSSCLIPLIISNLRNDSLLDMSRSSELYFGTYKYFILFFYFFNIAILRIIRNFCRHSSLISLCGPLPDQSTSIAELLTKLNTMSNVVINRYKNFFLKLLLMFY